MRTPGKKRVIIRTECRKSQLGSVLSLGLGHDSQQCAAQAWAPNPSSRWQGSGSLRPSSVENMCVCFLPCYVSEEFNSTWVETEDLHKAQSGAASNHRIKPLAMVAIRQQKAARLQMAVNYAENNVIPVMVACLQAGRIYRRRSFWCANCNLRLFPLGWYPSKGPYDSRKHSYKLYPSQQIVRHLLWIALARSCCSAVMRSREGRLQLPRWRPDWLSVLLSGSSRSFSQFSVQEA